MRIDSPSQIDLFAIDGAPAAAKARGRAAAGARAVKRGGRGAAQPRPAPDEEALAERLEASGRFRVLRRLEPRPVAAELWPAGAAPSASGTRLGIVLDTETTGLDHGRDEIIELGMVAFLYDESGIGEVVGVFNALREPGVPFGPDITRITGITPEMVAGQSIDLDAVARFIAPANLLIAHNARFDRPFCEGLLPAFAAKPWACSVAEVDWAGRGFEGSKLGYLVGQCGWFHNGHRAVDDCHALLAVLARPGPAGEAPPFLALRASAAKRRCRVFAEAAPFHHKDKLKTRGYRWSDGTGDMPKSWWREVEEDGVEAELAFLKEEVYGTRMDLEPHLRWLTAFERYRG
ncbi:DNA polymerase III subunit epsilon [Aureimonas endophytica]|uniref:DNA polymerase III subunit epsilon n=1 Tax=Aureimonas endophytica TaxID=2027858 RepID=A0A916ZTQ5_9HYPH|nr:3'-5' exonuclease [Aureimonas endophytica]GGE12144.1 DNA polymerase III subunit epsilon [Aureimonas endophytica]